MNAKRGFYNAIFGLLSQIISIALGIIIPRLVIVNLGSESNGLLSSINQALVYLNLLEAGIGTATLQALYRPVAQKNHEDINHVMSATNLYYRKVGKYYFLAACGLSAIFPFVVHSSLSPWIIVSVIMLSGLSQVINFFFQGKYRILMQAEGKSYILTNLGTIVNTFSSIGKIILLLNGANIAVLQLMYFGFSVLQMIYITRYIRKNYQWLDLSVKPDYEAISQKNSVMVHQISGLIFENTDVLVLTVVCGLKTVSVYSMYVMLFGMVGTAISTINSSVSFAMGQAYNTDKKYFSKLYNIFETYNMSLTFSLYCVANIFILPFLRLYTKGVSDVQYVDHLLPYLFIMTYLLSNGRSAAQRVIEYAGHFKLTQNRSIIESAINICVSLVCVFKFGIYGVLFGTIAALFYRTNDMILYSSHKLLKRSAKNTYFKWILNFILFAVIMFVSNKLFDITMLNSYIMIIIYAAITGVVVVAAFFVMGSVIDKESYLYCRDFIVGKIKLKFDRQ